MCKSIPDIDTRLALLYTLTIFVANQVPNALCFHMSNALLQTFTPLLHRFVTLLTGSGITLSPSSAHMHVQLYLVGNARKSTPTLGRVLDTVSEKLLSPQQVPKSCMFTALLWVE